MGFCPSTLLPTLLLLVLCTSLLPAASALRIIVAPTSTVNAPTNVFWVSESNDSFTDFDLRFVVNGADVGLAQANIHTSAGEGGVGREIVRFPATGTYQLVAVTGRPANVNVAASNEVLVGPATPITLASSPSTSSTNTNEPEKTPTTEVPPAGASSNKASNSFKAPIVIGATLGALLLLGLLIILVMFCLQRRRKKADEENIRSERLSFRPDEMIRPDGVWVTQERHIFRGSTGGRSRKSSDRSSRIQRLRQSIIGGKWIDDANISRETGASSTVETADNSSRRPSEGNVVQVSNAPVSITKVLPLPPSVHLANSQHGSVVRFEESPVASSSRTFITYTDSSKRTLPNVPEGAARPAIVGGGGRYYTRDGVQIEKPTVPALVISEHPRSGTPLPATPTTARRLPAVPASPSVRPLPSPAPPLVTLAKPVPKPSTKRQNHLQRRLVQVRGQLVLLLEKLERREIDENVGQVVRKDLEKQIEWLEETIEGPWAKEESDSLPEGFIRWMSP